MLLTYILMNFTKNCLTNTPNNAIANNSLSKSQRDDNYVREYRWQSIFFFYTKKSRQSANCLN